MVPPPLLKDTVELRRIRSLVFITHSPCRNDDWSQGRTTAKRTTLRTELIDTLLDITLTLLPEIFCFVFASKLYDRTNVRHFAIICHYFLQPEKADRYKQRWIELYRDVEWVLLKFATLRELRYEKRGFRCFDTERGAKPDEMRGRGPAAGDWLLLETSQARTSRPG